MNTNIIIMKTFRFLPILLTVLLSSCVRGVVDENPYGPEGEGIVKIALSVDDELQIVQSKADALDASLVPHADSVRIDLYRFKKRNEMAQKETWNRIYFDKYENAKDAVLRVNAGQYMLLAFHGDSTACGFDKPYFLAKEEFVVDGGLTETGDPVVTTVETEVKVSNVRISVNFDETVPGSYYDYFVRFARIDTSATAGNSANKKYRQILRYRMDETRDAYMMPTDSLQIQFMAQHEYADDESWKFVTLDTIAVKGNDHVTVNVKVTDPRYGKLGVTIVTDDNIVKEVTDIEIPETWAPQDAPQIVAAGFPDGEHAVVEGDATGNGATISVVARGGLKNLFFTVNDSAEGYLQSAGFDLPTGQEIDFVNPGAYQSHLAKLEAAGFRWQKEKDLNGSRELTYITMTDFFKAINEKNPSLSVKRSLATFQVRAIDEVGKETVLDLTASAYPVTQELSIPEGKAWATRIVSPELKVTKGVSSLFELQMSTDGVNWTEDYRTFVSADNSVLDFGTLDVKPDTKYWFRTVYNNNPNLISNVVEVTTEKILQVGNPGFEEYHTTIMHVSPLGWLYDYDREWYLPYNEGETDPWWAVNSKKTMPDGHTAWTSNFCKNFPCTAYSVDAHGGEKSAMVYTVNVGSANTDDSAVGTSVPGEIWIGTADDSGNHVTDGHAFASRPSSVKFWYKYVPNASESFAVYVVLKDASGAEIARTEKLDGKAASAWTQCEMPIVYSNTMAKAASIYICFKSCVSGGVKTGQSMEIAGKEQTVHYGSTLKIDDVELTY
ncbi:MAG: DUF4493 domain-containing protein [Bacteroidales bacterium]|nr:DUF4493 domain-containing protein [Bacteroidales bacterium]